MSCRRNDTSATRSLGNLRVPIDEQLFLMTVASSGINYMVQNALHVKRDSAQLFRLECEGHILKSTEFVNKQFNWMSQQKHIVFTWIYCLKNWGGDHLTITNILNMFCASISVRTEAYEEGLSQMQAYLMFR